jgi:hypothetical protein
VFDEHTDHARRCHVRVKGHRPKRCPRVDVEPHQRLRWRWSWRDRRGDLLEQRERAADASAVIDCDNGKSVRVLLIVC